MTNVISGEEDITLYKRHKSNYSLIYQRIFKMMKNARSPNKGANNKHERLQRLFLFTLLKLYTHKRGATDYCLNGLKIAINKLNDFWQEQKSSFKEIKEISDEEVPVNIQSQLPDPFFEDEDLPTAKHSLPTIIENEEEQSDNTIQSEVEKLWSTVSRLKEGEGRILERYKCELKALAVDLKNSEEKIKELEDENDNLKLSSKTLRNQIDQLRHQMEESEETQRKPHMTLKTKQKQLSQSIERKVDRGSQTDQDIEQQDKEYFQMLYSNEKDKLEALEYQFDDLKEKYQELQLSLQQIQVSNHNTSTFQDSSLEDRFKRELTVELSSLKNKITVLTEQADQAEQMLIDRDVQLKEVMKVNQSLQLEITQRRAQCSVLTEEKKTLESNLKVQQNICRKQEADNQRLQSIINQRDAQAKQINNFQKKEEKQIKSQQQKMAKDNAYKSLSGEIQQLNIENQDLHQQLANCQRQLKEMTEKQKSFKNTEKAQFAVANQEIDYLRKQLRDYEELIGKLEREKQEINEQLLEERVNENLNDAMEYLEMKDKEIERLRYENDSLRSQINHQDNYARYQQSPMRSSQKLQHPQDMNQVKDLQNLLMVMSKTLQEKEDQLKKYQRQFQF